MNYYGTPPLDCGEVEVEIEEFMTYLYLPVLIESKSDLYYAAFPERLRPLFNTVKVARDLEIALGNNFQYIYLTVKRGFAMPGYSLNREGWHCDGFGTDDINYVWSDQFPTRFWLGQVPRQTPISDSHIESLEQFETLANTQGIVMDGEDKHLYRLNPKVIHNVPLIPARGGMRTFVKISFSNSRYNLIGNSHNHKLDYDWKMYPRDIMRNDPQRAGLDFYEES